MPITQITQKNRIHHSNNGTPSYHLQKNTNNAERPVPFHQQKEASATTVEIQIW